MMHSPTSKLMVLYASGKTDVNPLGITYASGFFKQIKWSNLSTTYELLLRKS